MYYSRIGRIRQAALHGIITSLLLLLVLPLAGSASASGLTVILADHLNLADIYDSAAGPLTESARDGAVIALVSPGLPNYKGSGPVANLYATLSAGDVIDSANDHSGLLYRQLFVSGKDKDVDIIAFGDAHGPSNEQRLRSLIENLRRSGSKGLSTKGSTRAPGILLVGVTPPITSSTSGRISWDSLTPVVWLTCGGGSSDASLQPTLTSDTTHVTGLISLRDIAPTILDAESLPMPDSMSGHPAHVVMFGANSIPPRASLLRRIDLLTRVTARSVAPFGWTFGFAGAAVLMASFWCITGSRKRASPLLRFAVRALLATPLALLIAPLLVTEGYVALYLAEITVLCVALAVVLQASRLLLLTAVILIVDALCGAPLVSNAVISAYWLSGIRFYGIGNEYMGILIGMTLLAFAVPKHDRPFAPSHGPGEGGPATHLQALRLPLLAAWYLLVLFVLAYPQFGAKAGGAVTAMATFLPVWWSSLRGRAPRLRVWAAGVVLGFAAVLLLSVVAQRFGARETHIQAATTALSHGHLGYIAHIALRKARMAVKVALAPGALSGLAGMVVVLFIWTRSSLRSQVIDFLADKDDFRRGLIAGLWGILAAILFNDSGAVAALLLFGVLALTLLHEMLTKLCEYSPLMSGTSVSASPSATNLSSAPTRSSP